jgi:hypothetical protein
MLFVILVGMLGSIDNSSQPIPSGFSLKLVSNKIPPIYSLSISRAKSLIFPLAEKNGPSKSSC